MAIYRDRAVATPTGHESEQTQAILALAAHLRHLAARLREEGAPD